MPDRKRLSRSALVLFAVALSLSADSQVLAQAAPDVTHRVEVSAEFGLTAIHPYIGYSAARTPPAYEPLDESSGALLAGFGFRVIETPKTSTTARVQWGKVSDVTVTTTSATTTTYPPITYTLDRTLDTRTFTVSVSQSLDFRPRRSARPWLAAGFALSRLSADQQSTQTGVSDSGYHYSASESFRLTRVGVVLGGGIRFYPARHVVVGTEAGMIMLFGNPRGTSSIFGDSATWNVDSERRLFAVFGVGLAF